MMRGWYSQAICDRCEAESPPFEGRALPDGWVAAAQIARRDGVIYNEICPDCGALGLAKLLEVPA